MATLLRKKALALMIAISGATPSAQAGYFEWIKEKPLVSGTLFFGALVSAVSARFVNRQAQQIQLHKRSLDKQYWDNELKSLYAAMFLSNQSAQSIDQAQMIPPTNFADFILGATCLTRETGTSNFYGDFTVGKGQLHFSANFMKTMKNQYSVTSGYETNSSDDAEKFWKAAEKDLQARQEIKSLWKKINSKPCIII